MTNPCDGINGLVWSRADVGAFARPGRFLPCDWPGASASGFFAIPRHGQTITATRALSR